MSGAAAGVGYAGSAALERADYRAVRRRGATAPVARRRFLDSIGDYWYVGGDLRRIGVLAGSLVCLLVVLSVVLPVVVR